MKRSFEKSRGKIVPDVLPCDAARLVMGNTYAQPPAVWRTCERSCKICAVRFQVTAQEQRFWYEELHIPWVVAIDRCPLCRNRRRAERRILTRLGELMPQAMGADAGADLIRETVLVIAEGTLRRVRPPFGKEHWVLSQRPVLLNGSMLINRARKGRRPQHDLLPILQHFQHRLDNASRAARLEAEIARLRMDHPALVKALNAITDWMSTLNAKLRKRITEIPRI